MFSRVRSLVPVVAVVAAAVAAPSAVRAQQAPNLSGTWALDAGQSDFGMMPAPEKQTMVITHAEPKLTVATTTTTPRGERSQTLSYTTDGAESKNASPMGEQVNVLKWDGAVLTNTFKRQMQGAEINVVERWTLAPDGKVLTIARTIQAPMGEMAQRAVFTKQ